MRYCHRFGFVVSLSLAICSVGCESTQVYFAGSPSTSAVAGVASGTVHPLSVAGGEYGVQSIEWAEGGAAGGLDRPCYLEVGFRRLRDVLTPDEAPNMTYREVNVCNGGSYTNGSLLGVNLEFAREKIATGQVEPWYLYLNEIQTCDSQQSGNNRVKGIAAWGSFINGATPNPADYECHSSSGGASASSPCNEYEVRRSLADRTNCGTWSPRVACAYGNLASGVRVHVDNGNEIVGIALDCDEVVYETSE